MEKLIVEYLELFLAAYLVRFLFIRFIAEIPYLKKFYYMREILPGVKNWDNRLKMLYYFEIFSIFQSSFVALFIMVFYYLLSINTYAKVILAFLAYTSISVFEKLKFAVLMSDYPFSLLIMNIIIMTLISIFQFVVMSMIII